MSTSDLISGIQPIANESSKLLVISKTENKKSSKHYAKNIFY